MFKGNLKNGGDSGDMIINKVNDDITDIGLISSCSVSTNVSTDARR